MIPVQPKCRVHLTYKMLPSDKEAEKSRNPGWVFDGSCVEAIEFIRRNIDAFDAFVSRVSMFAFVELDLSTKDDPERGCIPSVVQVSNSARHVLDAMKCVKKAKIEEDIDLCRKLFEKNRFPSNNHYG